MQQRASAGKRKRGKRASLASGGGSSSKKRVVAKKEREGKVSVYGTLPEGVVEAAAVGAAAGGGAGGASSSEAAAAAEASRSARVELREFIADAMVSANPSATEESLRHNFDSKLRGKVLMLDNASSKTSLKRRMQLSDRRLLAQARPKKLSRQQQRKLGLPRIVPSSHGGVDESEQVRFQDVLPLFELWKCYIVEAAVNPSGRPDPNLLVKADLHGAVMVVTQCISPSYVGVSGIVVEETQKTFMLVTKDDRVVRIPKHGTVFQLHLALAGGAFDVELFGSHFCFRSADRSARKFKGRHTIEMS